MNPCSQLGVPPASTPPRRREAPGLGDQPRSCLACDGARLAVGIGHDNAVFAHGAIREAHGVVIGRVRQELIWIRTDSGYRTSMHVGPEFGSRLEVGQKARVTFDESGRPLGVYLTPPSTTPDGSESVQ